MWERNRISTNVLRDAAGFPGRDVCFPNDIEQRSFTVIDVTHDRDYRWPRFQVLNLVLDIEFNFLDRRVNDALAFSALFGFEFESIDRGDALGDLLIDGLVHIREHTEP